MNYPLLNRKTTACFSVEALRGGCNRRDGNHRTPDTQLTEAENLWWLKGALRTRPGFCTRADQEIVNENAYIGWKFCSEDTARGEDAGRRFLRRVLNRSSGEVTLQTGILTYDGRIVFEGALSGLAKDIVGMIMEYPYSDTENVLIFLSDGSVYAQNGTTAAWREVTDEAYVPCVLINGEGVKPTWKYSYNPTPNYEARNLLTDHFCAKYTTTSEDTAYYLPYMSISADQEITAKLTGADGNTTTYTIAAGATASEFTSAGVQLVITRTSGRLRFLNKSGDVHIMPDAGENNLTVYAAKARTTAEKRRIGTMGFSTWFGGSRAGCDSRQFLSGSAETPNRIYWSAQGQPLYFPETNYIAVGDINQAITAFGKQDGQLVIFKEREMYSLSDAAGVISSDSVDGQLAQGANATTDYFPMTQLHGQIGCMAPQTVQLCGNRLCWADGVGGVYTLIENTNGHTVRELSALITPALSTHSAAVWNTAAAGVYEGHYLLLVDHTLYVLRIDEKAFQRYASVYDDAAAQQQLAWFIWKLPASYSVSFLCGNGQAAVAVVTVSEDGKQVEKPLYAAMHMPDAAYTDGVWGTVPITAKLCTKEYDFGDPTARKRVLRVRLGMDGAADMQALFSYLFNGTEVGEAVILQGTPALGSFTLTPNCTRVTRFGIAVKIQGEAAVDSVFITYRH